jgi:hypothetical protein
LIVVAVHIPTIEAVGWLGETEIGVIGYVIDPWFPKLNFFVNVATTW